VRSDQQRLTLELLGALALVVEHLGGTYLLNPVEQWIRAPASRKAPISFR
jgi:hypothetical protein